MDNLAETLRAEAGEKDGKRELQERARERREKMRQKDTAVTGWWA